MFNLKKGSLTIVAQKGFKKDFLEHFKIVNAFDTSACGRAIGLGSPVVIQDINQDIAYSAHKEIAQSAGYRGVKSVPIYSTDHQLIGLISTHYAKPHVVSTKIYTLELYNSLSESLQQLVNHKTYS